MSRLDDLRSFSSLILFRILIRFRVWGPINTYSLHKCSFLLLYGFFNKNT
jgi:hypothetical protein